jgi:general secretion pathway protein N
MRRRLATFLTLMLLAAAPALAAPSVDPFAGGTQDLGSGISITRPEQSSARPASAPAPTGNPLWRLPLSALTVTQERPVFAPSRRPPPRAVAAAPVVMAAPPPQAPTPPAPLSLALIGAIVGDDDAIAVFIDRSTQGVVRMRAGQTHQGWALTAIQPRGATLTRDGQSETVALQRTDSNAATMSPATAMSPAAMPIQPPPGAVISPATGMVIMPGAAPFVPRSTPKNGASDGL